MLQIFLVFIFGFNVFSESEVKALYYKWDQKLSVSAPKTKLIKSKNLRKSTSKIAKRYKSSIEKAWKKAKTPNFARRYFVPKSIGCGTGCEMIFVIDWVSGEIFTAPEHHSFKVKKSSRLLVLKPYATCTAYGAPILYEFTQKNKFKEIPHNVCN